MNSDPENHPEIPAENHLPTYKERSGGEVLENPFSGGDGVSKRHTPIAIAQRGLSAPTVPGAALSFSPPIPPPPGHARILLSEAASQHLEAAGPQAFSIVHRDMSDGNAGRWVITLAPVEWQTARDAAAVLMGTARAVRPKAPKTLSPKTNQPKP